MMMKSQKTHTDNAVQGFQLSSSKKAMLSKVATRIVGVFTLGMSISLLVQAVPLLFIFLGGILGIPTDAKVNDMDTMIWLLTCVTMMVLVIYGFISWMKFVWSRFLVNPTPLFNSKPK